MKRKKTWGRILAFLATVLIGLTSLPNVIYASGTEDDPYIIGMDQTFTPFTFIDVDGEPAGIEIDIVDAVAKDQGFEYRFQVFSFSAALQALESNQIDGMVAGMAKTPEREQSFDFSEAYFSFGNQFAVLPDSPIETVEDLQGATISTKTGSTGLIIAQDMAEEYDFNLLTFEDSANMYEAVMGGQADAVIEMSAVMQFAISTGQVELRQIGEDINPNDVAFAVNGGQNAELLEMFDRGLANIQENGVYDEIVNRYLSEEAMEEGLSTTFSDIMRALFNGLWTTIWVSVVSLAIATILGLIFGLMRVSDNKFVKFISDIYVYAMRGIPMIVFAFFVYFGVSQWFNANLSPEVAGIAALSINTGAYIAEIVRGGIQGVPKGQEEAARSLGMKPSLTMNKIILPQAIRSMVPSLVNQFILALKNTSILSVIGMVELTMAGQIMIARTYQSGNIWSIVALMYIVLITLLTKISERIESKML